MKIVGIQPLSPVADHEVQAGDELVSINDQRIRDTIDYQFHSADEELTLQLRRNDVIHEVEVVKGLDEELGLDVEPMKMRACANDCVFCFADQNPPGVRESLNFRDGDYRFSFLHGHFITMTNMGPKQLERVVTQRLSPLYISIHVTDPAVRRKMLLFGKDDDIMGKLRYLTQNDITLHTQIVLCPDWNDGAVLRRTLDDLHALIPNVHTVSIVPVGLTRWRESLHQLKTVDPAYAGKFIDDLAGWEDEYRLPDGNRFIYLSDEWFILAGRDIPDDVYYDDYSMIENGVGQCRDFANRFAVQRENLPTRLSNATKLTFVTATLPHGFLKDILRSGLDGIENLEWSLVPIENDWLGAELVTVTGLLSARDIVMQLKEHDLGDAVYLSYRMFNEDGITLDDLTVEQIQTKLGVPVYVHHEDMIEVLTPWQ